MNDSNTIPPPIDPASSMTMPPSIAPESSRSGCMKWGLVGCAGLSVMLIVGLIFVGTRAGTMMDWALTKIQDQILLTCTPEVTAEQKAEFRAAYAPFIAKAKKGGIPAEKMSAFRKEMMAALSDGKVTPEELTELTNGLKQLTQ
jgi:hypothetical protein